MLMLKVSGFMAASSRGRVMEPSASRSVSSGSAFTLSASSSASVATEARQRRGFP